ncbi:MAG TPA: LytR C-terminal domain-containing protein [Ilumatobacter sp.]
MPRRAPRISDGGSPVSGALAIVLAIVAVVTGFLILRSISDGGEQALDFGDTIGAAPADSPDVAATTPDAPVATLPTTTTEPQLLTTGASVIVANANGIGGSASAMTRALETGAGFSVVDPVNAAVTIGDLDVSVIYFDPAVPAAQVVANSLAAVLGGVATVAPMPDPPPTRDGTLGGASVLLLLGNDKAGKTLGELAPADALTAVTNPPISGQGAATETTTG